MQREGWTRQSEIELANALRRPIDTGLQYLIREAASVLVSKDEQIRKLELECGQHMLRMINTFNAIEEAFGIHCGDLVERGEWVPKEDKSLVTTDQVSDCDAAKVGLKPVMTTYEMQDRDRLARALGRETPSFNTTMDLIREAASVIMAQEKLIENLRGDITRIQEANAVQSPPVIEDDGEEVGSCLKCMEFIDDKPADFKGLCDLCEAKEQVEKVEAVLHEVCKAAEVPWNPKALIAVGGMLKRALAGRLQRIEELETTTKEQDATIERIEKTNDSKAMEALIVHRMLLDRGIGNHGTPQYAARSVTRKHEIAVSRWHTHPTLAILELAETLKKQWEQKEEDDKAAGDLCT